MERQRIDRWLWHARIMKTRSQAADLAAGGHIRVNRDKVRKASHTVKVGDVITLYWGGRVRVLEVAGFSAKRGPAVEAETLYADRSPPKAPATPTREATRIARVPGSGRPTKKDRRATDRLRRPGS